MKKIFLLILLLTNLLQIEKAKAQFCNISDSLELVTLHNAATTWANPWILSQHVSTWSGITLDANGRVTKLVRTYANATINALPNLNLPYLTHLNFTGTRINGAIPNFNLPNLRVLNLTACVLMGSVPGFNHLPNLQELFLGTNYLSGVLPNFNLPNLKFLYLTSNHLTGAIPNFNLPNLEEFHLDYNQFNSTVPNFNLPNVKYLTVAHNALSGSVPNFNLPNLLLLDMLNNQLTGSIPNFDLLPNLTGLGLGNNLLNGSIPNFDNLPNLTSFSFDDNQLTGPIPNFNHIPNVTSFTISQNQLSGNIPLFENLPNVRGLNLSQNQLSGAIPNFNFPNLVYLNFSDNQLNDVMPNFIPFPNLQQFRIQDNLFNFGSFQNWNYLNYINAAIMYAPQKTLLPLTLNSGILTADLAGASNVANLTYTWYRDGIQVPGNPIIGNNHYVPTQAGNYSYKVTHATVTQPTYAYKNLILSSASVSVVACSPPTVTSVPNQTVCAGSNTTPVNFTGTGATSYTWTNNNTATGLAASGTGNIAAFSAINNTNSAIISTVTVTPVINSPSYAYIANYGLNTVSVINTTTNAVVGTISVGTTPVGVSVSPNGSRVYVTNFGSNTVSVIETINNTVVATIPVGAHPFGIAVTPNGNFVYVANQASGNVSIINASSNAVVATVSVSSEPLGICISPDGNFVYVTRHLEVSVIQTSDNTVLRRIPLTTPAFGISISPNGNHIYTANYDAHTVSIINTTAPHLVTNVPVGINPTGIAVSPNGNYIYVTNQGTDNVSIIPISDPLVAHIQIRVQDQPYGISVSPDGSRVYVTNYYSGTVSTVETTTNTVVATVLVHVDAGPTSLGNFIRSASGCIGTPTTFTLTVNPVGTGACNTIPIELTNFTAHPLSKNVQLTWQTASEKNNDHFDIERSTDGKTFSKIGEQKGYGTTNQVQNYGYLDTNPFSGVNYYRLKQVDVDGQFTYSKTVSVEMGNAGKNINVYPNPVKDKVVVETTIQGDYTIDLFDITGKLLKSHKASQPLISLTINDLPNGIYMVSVKSDAVQQTFKIVKQ